MARESAPYVGGALAAISVGIVAWQIGTLATELKSQFAEWSILTPALAMAVLYGLSLFALGSAWVLLIPRVSPASAMGWRALLRVYGVSSLGKYLPGNIFHFAGRQVLGARLGSAHASIAIATVFEIALSLLAALLVALTLMSFADSRPAAISPWHAGIMCAAAIGLIAALDAFGDHNRLFAWLRAVPPARGALTAAALCCLSFFFASALIAIAVHILLNGRSGDMAAIGAAYVLAWLAGYVVPGAPGGLGIREAAVIGILSPLVPPANALAVALVMRLVTTLGDAIFAGACFLLFPRPERQ